MFEDKMGFNQHLLCDDPDTRQGTLNWLTRVRSAFGDTPCVDLQIIEGQLTLNSKTADYLYSNFTSLENRYVPGSRPVLEKVLKDLKLEGLSSKEKFFKILRRCRDNPDGVAQRKNFDSGSEEYIIQHGSCICHEISRVFVVLCQVAGIPARTTCAHIFGHMMGEAYIDGKWAWCDPRYGVYAYKEDGTLASYWELIQDPSLLDQQDVSVWNDFRASNLLVVDEEVAKTFHCELAAGFQTKLRDCMLHPKESFAIGNYYAWEHSQYAYPLISEIKGLDPVQREKAIYLEDQMRIKFGYSAVYWSYRAHRGPLRLKARAN
jgi:hypothetical protein